MENKKNISQPSINRLILIGNGFDLAHNLRTSYKDFIYWYWKEKLNSLQKTKKKVFNDKLCKLTILKYDTWLDFFQKNPSFFNKNDDGKMIYNTLMKKGKLFEIEFYSLFEKIHNSLETKEWVDIENDYYSLLTSINSYNNQREYILSLNKQFEILKNLLTKYLHSIAEGKNAKKIQTIEDKMFCPIKIRELSWEFRSNNNDLKNDKDRLFSSFIKLKDNADNQTSVSNVLLLNFNYTTTPYHYSHEFNKDVLFIHGNIHESESIIFGFGDELDEDYKIIQKLNENECLRYSKSIKYLESKNYRSLLLFIESGYFQVCIMGHSCGNSDRTLLNTIFEHKNCVSIKPYYYMINKKKGENNYLDLVQNISRNFTDMKRMRDRVVNKEFCEPLI